MSVYVVMIILIVVWRVCTQVSDNKSLRNKKNYLIVVCLGLIIVAGARAFTVGADTITYVNGYHYYNSLPKIEMFTRADTWQIDYEIGYMLLMKVLAFVHVPETVFLIVVACLIYIPVCKCIYDYSQNACLSILEFVCIQLFEYSLGIFRQMIALGILLLSIKYIQKRNVKKYLLLVAVAMSFHFTAILFLPMYWLSKLSFKRIYILLFLVMEFVLLIFGSEAISLVLRLATRYSSYVDSIYGVSGGNYSFLILINFVFLLCALFRDRVKEAERFIYDLGLYALMIGAFLQILAYEFVVMGRTVVYFMFFIGLLLPSLYSHLFDRKSQKIVNAFTYALLFLYFCIATHDNQYIVPYHFVWKS